MTYSFGFVEVCHLNIAPVVSGEIEEVEGETGPEVQTGHPHEDGVLKALGEVGVAGVPRDIPVLGTQMQAQVSTHTPEEQGPRSTSPAAMGFMNPDAIPQLRACQLQKATKTGKWVMGAKDRKGPRPWRDPLPTEDGDCHVRALKGILCALKSPLGWAQHLTSIISATQGVEIRRMEVRSQPGQKVSKTPSQLISWADTGRRIDVGGWPQAKA
jgi:hypothetical protein